MRLNLRSDINELSNEIATEINHGECFYDEEEYEEFIRKLDRLRTLSGIYYTENQEDNE